MHHYSVWKYTLEVDESQDIDMPKGSEIISVETQGESIVIYALVRPQEEKDTYRVLVYGTGHDIHLNVTEYKFLGTAKFGNGELMFHVFYKRID
ncbi:hypothetical protein [Paenibacillus sp. ISL-20]|uniref:DUF7352 domain-containing protein n=1 Tax=Paenibacillus sp. ISL-20 TaxID=2819163 RepID=UPI001BEA4A0A|nr:hypothetical protein [Paenibacillus sp. ISL-20]MBT2759901.1 hypothetical protein [Paenibacillus sp. ISL-20]